MIDGPSWQSLCVSRVCTRSTSTRLQIFRKESPTQMINAAFQFGFWCEMIYLLPGSIPPDDLSTDYCEKWGEEWIVAVSRTIHWVHWSCNQTESTEIEKYHLNISQSSLDLLISLYCVGKDGKVSELLKVSTSRRPIAQWCSVPQKLGKLWTSRSLVSLVTSMDTASYCNGK